MAGEKSTIGTGLIVPWVSKPQRNSPTVSSNL